MVDKLQSGKMERRTHLKIDTGLCGEVIELNDTYAEVLLRTTQQMAADEQGLVHGGFIFGAADFAAMAAVNEPTVVLAASSCKFLAPSPVGSTIVFRAGIIERNEKKYYIIVDGYCGDTKVFTGEFKAVVTRKHVLE